jgi:hypothetical protein
MVITLSSCLDELFHAMDSPKNILQNHQISTCDFASLVVKVQNLEWKLSNNFEEQCWHIQWLNNKDKMKKLVGQKKAKVMKARMRGDLTT